ncbi:MAG: hypothetical protein DRN53_01385 [Thermoprotei archaeon]|nr:MAG: hypothetical protein DRN53_01385 [Thermoprotei archaeon]
MAERKDIFTKRIADSRYVEPEAEETEKEVKVAPEIENEKSISLPSRSPLEKSHIDRPRYTITKPHRPTLGSILREVLDEIGYDSSWIERLSTILKDIDRRIKELDREREKLVLKREKIKRLLEILEMI